MLYFPILILLVLVILHLGPHTVQSVPLTYGNGESQSAQCSTHRQPLTTTIMLSFFSDSPLTSRGLAHSVAKCLGAACSKHGNQHNQHGTSPTSSISGDGSFHWSPARSHSSGGTSPRHDHFSKGGIPVGNIKGGLMSHLRDHKPASTTSPSTHAKGVHIGGTSPAKHHQDAVKGKGKGIKPPSPASTSSSSSNSPGRGVSPTRHPGETSGTKHGHQH